MRLSRSRKPNYKNADEKSFFAHLFIKTVLIGAIASCALMPDKPNAAKAEPFRSAMSHKPPVKKIRRSGRQQAMLPVHAGLPAHAGQPADAGSYAAVGNASWYGAAFQGRRTANGEVFNMHKLTAAHKTLPLPSYARITNLRNGASLIVRVNDRGPYAHNRLIDLSQQAAQLLGYHSGGLAKVKVEYVGRAPKAAADEDFLRASYHAGASAVSFPR